MTLIIWLRRGVLYKLKHDLLLSFNQIKRNRSFVVAIIYIKVELSEQYRIDHHYDVAEWLYSKFYFYKLISNISSYQQLVDTIIIFKFQTEWPNMKRFSQSIKSNSSEWVSEEHLGWKMVVDDYGCLCLHWECIVYHHKQTLSFK